MRDQGRLHGPSNDPVEFLRRRLAEQDRKLDDLYRRLGDKPQKIEPPASGSSEYFKYIIDGNTSSTSASDEVVALSAGTGSFASSGVSLGSNIITLPVAKWCLGLTVEATYASGAPSSGDYHMGFDITSPYHPYVASLDYDEYLWTGVAPTFSGSNLYDITGSDQTVRVYHYTDSGETSYLYGMVWGFTVG